MTGEPAESKKSNRRNVSRWVARGSWLYLATVLAAAVLLRWPGENLSLNTLLLYSPRWALLLPVLLLVPLTCIWSWRGLGIVALAAVVHIVWFTGLELNWPSSDAPRESESLRIVTCNLQGTTLSSSDFQRYIEEVDPDIILVQEWVDTGGDSRLGDEWNFAESGGLLVASRLPLTPREGLSAHRFYLAGAVGHFDIDTSMGRVRLVNVHLPTVREGLQAVIDQRLNGLPQMASNMKSRDRASTDARYSCEGIDRSLIVAGDFNLPEESSIFRKHWGDLGNAFADAGLGWGYTKYTRWHGIRIDHVLYDPAWTCTYSAVGPDIGSDHRPVLAVLKPTDPP